MDADQSGTLNLEEVAQVTYRDRVRVSVCLLLRMCWYSGPRHSALGISHHPVLTITMVRRPTQTMATVYHPTLPIAVRLLPLTLLQRWVGDQHAT